MTTGLSAQNITGEDLERIRESFEKSPENTAMQNIISNSPDLKSLALNRELQGKIDHYFKYRVNVSGITDQESSGRCWMFTSMNVLRPAVMKKFNISSFDFSHNFCYFWDIFEKSNLFLENVIATAEKDILMDRDVAFYFQSPVSDGGVWNSFLNIAEKYGAVPADVMPETVHSIATRSLVNLLNEYLRIEGYRLKSLASEKMNRKKAEERKMEIMKGVYRILALCLGEPPVEFTWRYQDTDGAIKTLETTPMDFYRSIIPDNYGSGNYIMVMHDPTRAYYKVYEISNYRNCYEGVNWKYLNLPIEEIKTSAITSIKSDEALYTSSDVGKFHNTAEGVSDPDLYNYSALFGLEITDNDKKSRILTRQSGSSHAMALIAVDTDKNGKPTKWQMENSWGPTAGHGGYLTVTDKWLTEYLFRIVINKKYLSTKAISALKSEPVILPAWDYMF